MEKELALKSANEILSKPTDIRSIVTEDEAYLIKFEVRARLILNKVSKDDFFNHLFTACDDNISIKELARELSRKPLELPYEQSLALARYSIEPRDTPTIEFNNNREQPLEPIKHNLNKTLEILYDFEENFIEKTLQKLKGKESHLLNQLTSKRNPKQWIKALKDVDPNLAQLDKDILIAIGFEKNRDVKKLSVNVDLRCN